MAFSILTLPSKDMPVSVAEGTKILERDHFSCRYCGLDGRSSLENALVMSIDFVVPRAHGGKKNPANLVVCCRPCKTIKGTRVYHNFEEARKYVLARREALRQVWETRFLQPAREVPDSQSEVNLCAGL
jgi:5-methylcytosine-specific restriction endonuclease McrA